MRQRVLFVLLGGIGLASCNMFREWQPQFENAKVPETEEELARRYLFPSVEEMEKWLLMSDDDIVAGKDEDQMAALMDGRFVCDPKKITQPMLGRVTRGGDLNIWGTNLGGFLVLEPWITPSLFYQFLGVGDRNKIGMDMKTFCTALGEEEANKQLRRHWATWVTEDDIRQLAQAAVNTLRIPVGDWQFAPYDPYVKCTEGANEELHRVLDLCQQYGIDVVLDMHALRGSMNGLDNSGEAMTIEWFNDTHFRHWPVLDAQWIGHFNANFTKYTTFDFDNFKHSLDAFEGMVRQFSAHPAVVAFQPVNEPWAHTPPNAYQIFVWTAYNMVQLIDSNLGLIVHDSFRGSSLVFRNWLVGCKNIVTDTHLYTAWDGWWSGALDEDHFVTSACAQAPFLHDGQQRVPHMVGEWSLATDNCAMWLNGFNDNPIGYPQVACDWVECPAPYMGPDQPGAPPNASLPAQMPIGTGFSTPVYGQCPIDKTWEDDNATMTRLARAKLAAFSLTSGSFMWNFKTELEAKWSFLESTRRGWLPDMNQAKTDPNYMASYLDGVCDEIWYKMGFKKRPPVPLPLWAKVLRWGGVVMVAIAGLALFMYTGIEVYRRYYTGYDEVEEEESEAKRQKRVQSMPLFYSHAYQTADPPSKPKKGTHKKAPR